MRRLHADFNRTFKALESGLQVEHIAEFDLRTCRTDDLVTTVLSDPDFASFDNFPVCNDEHIVGVLERSKVEGCSDSTSLTQSVMVPLNSAMLASNGQPVSTLLDAFHTMRYRLVVRGSGVEGIVTPSDLLKLPVRLYAFMLATHVEMLMAAIIRSKFRGQPNEAWMGLLSDGRRCKVQEKIDSFSARKLDPDPIELTDFCDKRQIIKKHLNLSTQFVDQMKLVEELRNSLAHASNYISRQEDLDTFLQRVKLAHENIEFLSSRLEPESF